MHWQEVVRNIDGRHPINQTHKEFASNLTLETLLENVPFGNVESVKLSPLQRSVVFHGTREYDPGIFMRRGFIAFPDYDLLTHDICTASNSKWCDGLITAWNPPSDMLSPGDRSSFGVVSPISEELIGQHVEETKGRYAFTVDASMKWLSGDYLLSAFTVSHDQIRNLLTIINNPYLNKFTDFRELVEELTRLLIQDGNPQEIYHKPDDMKLSLTDILIAAAVKFYESQFKFEAQLIQQGVPLDRFDQIPDYGIGPYHTYKKIKRILANE